MHPEVQGYGFGERQIEMSRQQQGENYVRVLVGDEVEGGGFLGGYLFQCLREVALANGIAITTEPITDFSKEQVVSMAKPLDSGVSGIKRKPEAPIIELSDITPFVNLSKKPQKGCTCSLCGITTSRKEDLDQHFKGKKHKRKEIEAGGDGRGLSFKNSLIHAEVQGYGFGEKQMEMSKQQQGENYVRASVGDEKKWICLLCAVTTTSEQSLNGHMTGKMHQAKLAMQKALAVLVTTKPVNKNVDNSHWWRKMKIQ